MTKKVSKKELVDNLQNFAEILNDVPTAEQVRNDNEYTNNIKTYQRRFGSWNDALKSANLNINRIMGMSDEYMVGKLQALTNEIGRVPRQADVTQSESTPSVSSYQERFGSWNNALQEAGYNPNQIKNIPDTELLEELTKLSKKLGRPPKYEELANRDDTFSPTPYEETFGSWNNALEAANIEVRYIKNIPEEYMLDKLVEIKEELGRTPKYEELEDFPTAPSTYVYEQHFESYNEALRKAGLKINVKSEVSKQELIEELQVVEEDLGRTPSVEEFRAMDDVHGVTTIARKFGNWTDAIEEAGLDLLDWSGENHPRWKENKDRKIYYGPEWPEQRKKAIKRDNERCLDCGRSRPQHQNIFGSDLHVHHRQPLIEYIESPDLTRQEGNELENLVTLCAQCHQKWEKLPVQIYSSSTFKL